MDLMDFEAQQLYFDNPMAQEVESLIQAAADMYGNSEAEEYLLQAYELAPDNLTVLVALYRYYYYQYRLQDSLRVADMALEVSGGSIDFPREWRDLTREHLGNGAVQSMGMVRFYMYALKAAGFLNIRIGEHDLGIEMLSKVSSLDDKDRMGAKALLDVVLDSLGIEGDAARHMAL